VNSPEPGVTGQLSVGTVQSPLASVISAPLEGTTKPDQFKLRVNGGADSVTVCVDVVVLPVLEVAVTVNNHDAATSLAGTVA